MQLSFNFVSYAHCEFQCSFYSWHDFTSLANFCREDSAQILSLLLQPKTLFFPTIFMCIYLLFFPTESLLTMNFLEYLCIVQVKIFIVGQHVFQSVQVLVK